MASKYVFNPFSGNFDNISVETMPPESDPVFNAWTQKTVVDDNYSNWNTAYSWGDHDGLYDTVGSAASSMTSHEDTYNHTLIATALQSETDPVFNVSPAASITTTDILNLSNLSGENTGDQTLIHTMGVTVDGGGSAITTGIKGYFKVPYSGTITSATLIADQSGSCVIDVWKDTTIPTVDDTITASAKPTLSSEQTSTDSTLTGWTTSISAGDYIGYNVDSASTVTRVTLILEVEE